MSPESVAVRVALFYAALFVVIGIRMPYFPLWLSSRGLDAAEIGMVLAVQSWVQVAAAPWVASRVDRRGERRLMLAVLTALSAVGYAVYALAGTFAAILVVAVAAAAVFTPVIPLGDNLAMLAVQRWGIDYGRARLWGSITFIAASSGAGWLVAEEADRVLWLIIGALAATSAAACLLPDIRTPRRHDRIGALRSLVADRRFMLFLATAGCLQASHAMIYGFGTLHWRANGLDPAFIGVLWAEGVIAEIVFFAFGRRAAGRLGDVRLMAAAGIAGLVRWPLTAIGTDPVLLAVLQPLHAATFAAAHLGAMHWIARTVPPERSATAQSLHSAIASGIAFGIAMPVSGLLYGWLGGAGFLAMTLLSAAGLAGALRLRRG